MSVSRPMPYEVIFDTVLRETNPLKRWETLAASLADVGLDQINYGFLDIATAERMEARCDPALTTMEGDWIRHYVENRYDLDDHVLAHVRAGNYTPMSWNDAPQDRTRAFLAYSEACEAGLKSGILVPLAGPLASNLPGAAILIGSSVGEKEFRRMVGPHITQLVSLAHLFHAGAVGELLRRHDGAQSLSPRERDALLYVTKGMRLDEVAHQLGVARVTVELHLRNARRKLRCRTLAEAVARAMLYGELRP